MLSPPMISTMPPKRLLRRFGVDENYSLRSSWDCAGSRQFENTAAFAQSATESVAGSGDNNPDPVFVFNRICYVQVHDFDAILRMSQKLAWRTMPDSDLKELKSSTEPTVLKGWDAQVGERLFRVGITKAPISESMLKSFPDFAGGETSSCSLILDDQQDSKEFMPNMQRLVGKEPVTKDIPEGLLRTTTWAGGNADLKVFVFAKAPPTGRGGLLNVTILQKKK